MMMLAILCLAFPQFIDSSDVWRSRVDLEEDQRRSLIGLGCVAVFGIVGLFLRYRAKRGGRVRGEVGTPTNWTLAPVVLHRLAWASGLVAIVAGVFGFVAYSEREKPNHYGRQELDLSGPLFICSFAMMSLSKYLDRMAGRRDLILAAEGPIPEDRPLVLFLRGFERDGTISGLGVGPFGSTDSREELLLDPLHDRATVVGFASARYGGLGFVPLAATQSDWQRRVRVLIEGAALVVVLVDGRSDGLAWEIEQLGNSDHLKRSAFVVIPSKRAEDTLERTMFVIKCLESSDSAAQLALRSSLVDCLRQVSSAHSTMPLGFVVAYSPDRQFHTGSPVTADGAEYEALGKQLLSMTSETLATASKSSAAS